MTLTDTLKNQCLRSPYTSIDTLYKLAQGHKQATVDRTMRRLCEKGVVSPYMNQDGAIVGYNRTATPPGSQVVNSGTPGQSKQVSMFGEQKKGHWEY